MAILDVHTLKTKKKILLFKIIGFGLKDRRFVCIDKSYINNQWKVWKRLHLNSKLEL